MVFTNTIAHYSPFFPVTTRTIELGTSKFGLFTCVTYNALCHFCFLSMNNKYIVPFFLDAVITYMIILI